MLWSFQLCGSGDSYLGWLGPQSTALSLANFYFWSGGLWWTYGDRIGMLHGATNWRCMPVEGAVSVFSSESWTSKCTQLSTFVISAVEIAGNPHRKDNIVPYQKGKKVESAQKLKGGVERIQASPAGCPRHRKTRTFYSPAAAEAKRGAGISILTGFLWVNPIYGDIREAD